MPDEPVELERFPEVTIESDGIWSGTVVKVDGKPIDGVYHVAYELGVPTKEHPDRGFGELTIKIVGEQPFHLDGPCRVKWVHEDYERPQDES